MASELLAIPEDHLVDFATVVRIGLAVARDNIHPDVVEALEAWIEETVPLREDV